jgi:Rad3-related DNA helicase
LSEGRCYDRRRIEQVAAKHKVCPYELSLDVSEYCDVIIADYNYAFDPLVYLRRYFSQGAPLAGKNVFLVDEAHNLVDRARDMYSAVLSRRAFERLYARVDRRDRTLNEALETVIRAMRKMKSLCRENLETDAEGKDCGFYMSRSPLCDFSEMLNYFTAQCDGWLRLHREEDIANEVSELCYTVKEYACVMEHYDEHYVTYVELSGGDTTVRLVCLDPSGELDILQHRAVSTTMFSATLTPLDYFADVLGGGPNAEKLALPSPYDKENFGLFAVSGISTRYAERQETARAVAGCIGAAVSGKRGNYIVYFPSYSYLETVLVRFRALYPSVTTVVQKKGMRVAEREAFLDAFRDDSDVLRVGFCVLGGSFSEGVDLPGSRLIGSVIVGVGLSGISGERNLLQEYYQNKSEMGREYAYIYPGMNRVLQAAGRVIRREEDRGIVVLLDDRYETPAYTHLFPNHWMHLRYARNPKNLAEMVRDFWERQAKNE